MYILIGVIKIRMVNCLEVFYGHPKMTVTVDIVNDKLVRVR